VLAWLHVYRCTILNNKKKSIALKQKPKNFLERGGIGAGEKEKKRRSPPASHSFTPAPTYPGI
jgi:hypothetical protein